MSELLDLFPTLCELTGIDVPDFVDGKSLVPVLKDPQAVVHDGAISQYYRRNDGNELMGYTIRTETHRLVQWRKFETGEVVAEELYDHRTDPSERMNIAGDDASAEILGELNETLVKTHPSKKLQMTPAIHSNPTKGRLKADISFENQSNTQISVIPITTKGARARRGIRRLEPGESATINARIGGVFVVESLDGTIHQIHSPSVPTNKVVIKGSHSRVRAAR
jgi:iduronate 2-sulfatase